MPQGHGCPIVSILTSLRSPEKSDEGPGSLADFTGHLTLSVDHRHLGKESPIPNAKSPGTIWVYGP